MGILATKAMVLSLLLFTAYSLQTPAAVAGQILDGTLLTIVFIDVGQGDSALVILPNSKTLLIDGGERQNSNGVFETLGQYDIDIVDVMVATHPHADHIGGLVEVIDSNVSVGEVLDSGQEYSTRTFEDLLDGIDREHIPLTSVKKGDFIELDPSVNLEVLNPQDPAPRGIEDEVNNNSVVIKLSYGNFSALFTGDMEQYNELALLNATDGSGVTTTNADDDTRDNNLLDVDVLKVGHHGSSHSSTSDFLRAVSPETAVISSGAGNSYGHPHREALDRLQAAGVEHILRTDLDGTITIEASANGEYSIAAEKTGRIIVAPEFGGVLYIGIAALGVVFILLRLGIPWKR